MKPKKKNSEMMLIAIGCVWLLLMVLTAAASSATMADPTLNFFSAFLDSPSRISTMGLDAFRPSSSKFPSNAFMVTFVFGMAVLLYWINEKRNAHMLAGKESGSAEWNTDIRKYNETFTSPYGKPTVDGKNAILTQDIFMGMNGKKTKRNLNTLVIGGAGAGKSRFYVKPNVLQDETDCNFVITDPSGELLESCGSFLEERGYKISVLNLTYMAASYCYNPFDYIRKEEDVPVLINCLIKNTTPPGSSKGDPFWEKSETALLTAIFFYLRYHRPANDRNFASVMKLLRAANIDEEDSSSQSPLDIIFESIGEKDKNDVGYKSYQTFRMGAGKTLKSILISAAVRLNSFEIPAVAALIRHDYEHEERNIDLKALGCSDQKMALFCILPQADDTYNFIVSMMYYQLFESLYYYAEHEEGGLKHPVRFMLDEFCNIGQIPDFDKKLATMRKYGLSCSIICQNKKQLEEMYDKKTEGIIGNCDEFLFLGSPEPDTQKYVSDRLGKTTITVRNSSRSQGRSSSSSSSYNQTGRELLTPDEVGRMPDTDCILFVRGELPFYGKKYDYVNHPNYKYTGDANKDNKYDIVKKFSMEDNDIDAMPESNVNVHSNTAPNLVLKEGIKGKEFVEKVRNSSIWSKITSFFEKQDTETVGSDMANDHNTENHNSMDDLIEEGNSSAQTEDHIPSPGKTADNNIAVAVEDNNVSSNTEDRDEPVVQKESESEPEYKAPDEVKEQVKEEKHTIPIPATRIPNRSAILENFESSENEDNTKESDIEAKEKNQASRCAEHPLLNSSPDSESTEDASTSEPEESVSTVTESQMVKNKIIYEFDESDDDDNFDSLDDV